MKHIQKRVLTHISQAKNICYQTSGFDLKLQENLESIISKAREYNNAYGTISNIFSDSLFEIKNNLVIEKDVSQEVNFVTKNYLSNLCKPKPTRVSLLLQHLYEIPIDYINISEKLKEAYASINLDIFDEVNIATIYSDGEEIFASTPIDWIYPWSNRQEYISFANTVISIACSHVLRLHLNAFETKIIGMNAEKLLLGALKEEWVDIICDISGLSRSIAGKIFEYHIFGVGVDSPDPSLQYFIPIDGKFFILPLLTATLDFERNALVLHGRVEKSPLIDRVTYLK